MTIKTNFQKLHLVTACKRVATLVWWFTPDGKLAGTKDYLLKKVMKALYISTYTPPKMNNKYDIKVVNDKVKYKPWKRDQVISALSNLRGYFFNLEVTIF